MILSTQYCAFIYNQCIVSRAFNVCNIPGCSTVCVVQDLGSDISSAWNDVTSDISSAWDSVKSDFTTAVDDIEDFAADASEVAAFIKELVDNGGNYDHTYTPIQKTVGVLLSLIVHGINDACLG